MNDILQVVTTTSSQQEAQRLADELVSRRLAACVQIVGPITSTYHWQGKIERSPEWLCVAKTTSSCYHKLEVAIRELHSYEVPEILAFPASQASRDYAQWLQSELRGAEA